jgi:purine-binding chemotaxis protein CheW
VAKYIEFGLGEERFGIDVLTVQEILLPGELGVTPIPNAPPSLLGVINLRGKIIPCVDLRTRIGLPSRPFDDKTRVVMLKVDTTRIVGVVVDYLTEVREIPSERIEAMRSETDTISDEYIIGVFKEEGRLLVVVDVIGVLYDVTGGRLGSNRGVA